MGLLLVLLCIEGVVSVMSNVSTVKTVSTAYECKKFITRGEKNYIGNDKGLLEELARRMAAPENHNIKSVIGSFKVDLHPPKIPPAMNSPPFLLKELTPFETEDPQISLYHPQFDKITGMILSESGMAKPEPGMNTRKSGKAILQPGKLKSEPQSRKWWWWSKPNTAKFYGSYVDADTNDQQLADEQLKAMYTSIIALQTKLRQVDFILKKYAKDIRFRMGYIMSKLDQWKRDMHIFADYTSYNEAGIHRQRPPEFTLYWHLVYFGLCLRNHIDVTYSIDYLILLHKRQMLYAEALQKKKIEDLIKLNKLRLKDKLKPKNTES